MVQKLVEQEIILYIMGVLVVIGAFAKLISAVTVRNIAKAASEIQKSNHRLMKLVKAKFEHASLLSDRVQNVGAFVDKYLYEHRILGIRMESLRVVPRKLLLFIGVLGVFGIFESYRLEGMGNLTLEYLQWTGLLGLFLGLLCILGDEKMRLSAARNYMLEYFENVCISRYAKKHQPETIPEPVPEPEKESVQKEEEIKPTEDNIRSEQEMRIRAILEEFLA